MSNLSFTQFIHTLPEQVLPALPIALRGIHVRQPYRWLIQFHYGEPWLHYEVSRTQRVDGWELGFHCESRDAALNRYLLFGFRRHLFEIKDALGEAVEAEMWDKGWTKIYEVIPSMDLSRDFQASVGSRLAQIIVVLHPIYIELRNDVARVYR